MPDNRPKAVLLFIEDSPEDHLVMLRALKKADAEFSGYLCRDGDEALDFLFRRGKYADRKESPRPDLILLDLNLPGIDGMEFLGILKEDKKLRSIPVLVFSTSKNHHDVQSCYQMGGNAYLHKPLDTVQFSRAIAAFKEFWLETAILPIGENHD